MEAEVEHLRSRMSRVEDLERDRDALLDTYVELIAEQIREPDPGQRRQVYALLRIRLTIRRGSELEVTGVLGTGNLLCENALTSPRESQFTKTLAVTFRAFLGDGSPQIVLETSAVR